MSNLVLASPLKKIDAISPLLSTFITVMILFFVDEGHYDFRWMMSWGHWIVFLGYLVLLFPFQLFLSHFVLSRWTNAGKGMTGIFINTLLWTLGLILIFALEFTSE